MFQAPKNETSRREAEHAAKYLGVELDGLTEEALKAAFRKRVRQAHPDASGYDPMESAQVVDVASEVMMLARTSRDLLHNWLSSLPDDSCPQCKGKGFVRSGFGAKPCPRGC